MRQFSWSGPARFLSSVSYVSRGIYGLPLPGNPSPRSHARIQAIYACTLPHIPNIFLVYTVDKYDYVVYILSMPEVEKKTLCFRADPWLVEWIQKRAAQERRTLGAMIRILLEKLASGSKP
jgi:hypothetical protein